MQLIFEETIKKKEKGKAVMVDCRLIIEGEELIWNEDKNGFKKEEKPLEINRTTKNENKKMHRWVGNE